MVSGLLFAACDTEVVQIGTGGAGTSSSKATSATNATATGNTSATTSQAGTTAAVSSVGSTGTGMPDCAAACDKLSTQCMIPLAQCQMYLDCSQPQGQCAAQCVTDPSIGCMDVYQAFMNPPSGAFYECYQACQGSSTTGSMSTGTGTTQTCGQCVQSGMGCQSELQQCFQANAQECAAWGQCAMACSTPGCLDMCTTQHPVGAPVAQCACTTCANACSATCN
ncbi:MAG: hypothetical protein U0414_35075 [Polyangiaceae bacterium]